MTIIGDFAKGFANNFGLARIIPLPRIGLDVGTAIANGVGVATAGTPVGTAASGGMQDLQELLEMQRKLQEEMMRINMQSNIMRTESETKMAPVRNMRVA